MDARVGLATPVFQRASSVAAAQSSAGSCIGVGDSAAGKRAIAWAGRVPIRPGFVQANTPPP
jgi:hypothetical protein